MYVKDAVGTSNGFLGTYGRRRILQLLPAITVIGSEVRRILQLQDSTAGPKPLYQA
jgi:hypothetical protein